VSAEADAAFAAWVKAEVATWPLLGPGQVAELRALLDLRSDPQDALTAIPLPPAPLSESSGSITFSIRAANSPELTHEAVPQ
jgi:hypothetical protein